MLVIRKWDTSACEASTLLRLVSLTKITFESEPSGYLETVICVQQSILLCNVSRQENEHSRIEVWQKRLAEDSVSGGF